MAKESSNHPCSSAKTWTTSPILCLIQPSRIHYLCSLLEAYEGIALTTTLDPKLGLVRLNVAPGCEEDVHRILQAEKETLQLREIISRP